MQDLKGLGSASTAQNVSMVLKLTKKTSAAEL